MKVIDEIKKYFKFIKDINLSILSSSLTFYIVIIFIPLLTIVEVILDYLNIISVDNILENESYLSGVFLIVSIVFIILKFISSITAYSSIIYKERISNIRSLIRSVIFVFILILLISFLFLISFYLDYLFKDLYKFYGVIKSLYLLFSITLVNGIIYKYIIPIKVRFKNTLFVSLLITITWYIIFLIYRLGVLKFNSYDLIYYHFSDMIVLIWLIYFLSYSFLLGIVINYYLDFRNKLNNVGDNNIEQ